jgi:hypothetical protein
LALSLFLDEIPIRLAKGKTKSGQNFSENLNGVILTQLLKKEKCFVLRALKKLLTHPKMSVIISVTEKEVIKNL